MYELKALFTLIAMVQVAALYDLPRLRTLFTHYHCPLTGHWRLHTVETWAANLTKRKRGTVWRNFTTTVVSSRSDQWKKKAIIGHGLVIKTKLRLRGCCQDIERTERSASRPSKFEGRIVCWWVCLSYTFHVSNNYQYTDFQLIELWQLHCYHGKELIQSTVGIQHWGGSREWILPSWPLDCCDRDCWKDPCNWGA